MSLRIFCLILLVAAATAKPTFSSGGFGFFGDSFGNVADEGFNGANQAAEVGFDVAGGAVAATKGGLQIGEAVSDNFAHKASGVAGDNKFAGQASHIAEKGIAAKFGAEISVVDKIGETVKSGHDFESKAAGKGKDDAHGAIGNLGDKGAGKHRSNDDDCIDAESGIDGKFSKKLNAEVNAAKGISDKTHKLPDKKHLGSKTGKNNDENSENNDQTDIDSQDKGKQKTKHDGGKIGKKDDDNYKNKHGKSEESDCDSSKEGADENDKNKQNSKSDITDKFYKGKSKGNSDKHGQKEDGVDGKGKNEAENDKEGGNDTNEEGDHNKDKKGGKAKDEKGEKGEGKVKGALKSGLDIAVSASGAVKGGSKGDSKGGTKGDSKGGSEWGHDSEDC